MKTIPLLRCLLNACALLCSCRLSAADPKPTASPPMHVSSPSRPSDILSSLFDYDRSAANDLKQNSTQERHDVIVADVSFPPCVSRHGSIKAYVVRPKGPGPFAGLLFFHWLGETKPDRSEFLEEAVELAGRGAVALLIQGYFPWSEKPFSGQNDRQQLIDQTVDLRRALDLLLSQPGVDAHRIGFVGHDYGAMYGAILAGIDKKVAAFVLMAGIGSFSEWSLKYWPRTGAQGEQAYRQALNAVDPIHYVGGASPAALLFQFSTSDKFISKDDAMAFFAAASEPKELKWYNAPHDLNVESARHDRRQWLTQQLRLGEPVK